MESGLKNFLLIFSFTEATRKLNEQTAEINMNPEPNLDTFVFLRAKQAIGEYLLRYER